MKKVLFVINTLGGAGAEKALLELLKRFPENEYEVLLYVLLAQGELIHQVPEQVKILNQSYSDASVLSKKGKHILNRQIFKRLFVRGAIFKNLGYMLKNMAEMLKKGKLYPDKLLWRVMADSAQVIDGHYDMAVAFLEGGSTYYIHDHMLKMSACLIYTFANLSLNHIHSARMGLNRLTENLDQVMKGNTDRKAKAFGVFVAVAAHTLLHLPVGDIPPLSDYVGEFKKGKQLWGVYVLAHKAYLDREYQRSLGIVEACLMTTKEIYPISMIYLNLVAAMNAMNLMQTELAKKYFMQAWEIARPDGLIEGIGEHHGLLQGLIETCLKKDYPEDYERIIAITYKFSFGWRRIHNPDTNEYVADNLTTTEFTIAMLASRGWTNQEIADYMQITPRTVKQHMTCIFNKMSISNRKQLKDYMLR